MAAPRPGFGADAALPESRLDERREHVRGNLLEAHHRPGLVERPPRADHLLHQARLGAGEHVADLALLLRGGAQRVLDAAAVEAVDRLELVERDDDRALLFGREAAGQREDLVGEPVDVAVVLDEREGHGEAPRARCVGS